MLKILSWNIRQGGGSRLKFIRTYLHQSNAQIILLSEYRNNHNGLNLRHSLLLNGYRYQAVTVSKSDENSVLLVSKLPFSSTLYTDIDQQFSGNIVKASFPAFNIYGCYLPHKKKHELFNFLLKEIEAEEPAIIVGDLNSGINGEDQEGSSFWYEDELKLMHTKGMIDAFREKNGSVKDYSWISHQGNGYRYDHSLIDEKLVPVFLDCYYDHEVRIQNISDHSAMYLELGG